MTYFKSAPHPPSERRTDAGQLPRGCSASPLFGTVLSDETPVCSAKGCRTDAVWVLVWNNPKLHTPERRKTWLACDEHREHLSQFLGVRGFLKDVVTLVEWEREQPAGD